MTSLTAAQAEAMRARLNVTRESFAAAAADAGVVLLPDAFDERRVCDLVLALRQPDLPADEWRAKREELEALLLVAVPNTVYRRWRLPTGGHTGRFSAATLAWAARAWHAAQRKASTGG